jgi:hypothetical protein
MLSVFTGACTGRKLDFCPSHGVLKKSSKFKTVTSTNVDVISFK